MNIRSSAISLIVVTFVICATGAAPVAHAQRLSNSCSIAIGGEDVNIPSDCPSGYRCDPISLTCVSSLTPSGGGGVQSSVTNSPSQTQSSATNIPGSGTKLINPLQGGGDLQSFLINILKLIVRVGSIAVVLMLVYVGYLFVMAQGKESEIREARNALLWTVIGALILLGSQAIALGIEATVRAISTGN